MRFEVTDYAAATRALDYFNGFHDGFIRELRVTTHDRFVERGVHETAGPVDLEIVFAHYNYERDTRPPDQLIRATFRGVTALAVDIAGRPTETAIRSVEIEAAEGAQTASVLVSRLTEEREWIAHTAVAFRFDSASFEEL